MLYRETYNSKIGPIYLISNGVYLTGLYFKGSRDDILHKDTYILNKNLKIFDDTKRFLDIYFDGKEPSFTPLYKLDNLSPFRRMVTDILLKVPYGKVVTYGDIAKEIAKRRNIKKMSSQAVGGALKNNPICIIVPCHRVIGENGNLTGYGGGIDNKIKLLEIEGHDKSLFSMPKGR